MKFTMRDKVCQLIGKYQQKEEACREQDAVEFICTAFGTKPAKRNASENAVKMQCYQVFLDDLKELLKEDNTHE